MAARSAELGLQVPVTDALSPTLWKERYAWGVNLGGSETLRQRVARWAGGSDKALQQARRLIDDLPDDTIRWHLRCALSDLEVRIGLPMGVQICKAEPLDSGVAQGRDYDRVVPRLPLTRDDTEYWWRVQLPGGVISVERLRGYYLGVQVLEEVPATSLRLQWAQQGLLYLLPMSVTQWLVGPNSQFLQPLTRKIGVVIPDFWAADYTLGPVWEGQAGTIPAVAAQWVGCTAGLTLLALAGAATTKGLQGSSVSLDGASQNLAFQADLFGALRGAYKEIIESIDWKRLQLRWRGIRVKAYGH